MIAKTTLLLLAASFAGINAARLGAFAARDRLSERLAAFVPQDLSARSVNTAGGWALSLPEVENAACPAVAPGCGSNWCCPGALACQNVGNDDISDVCCPTSADCTNTFVAAPVCADSSWSLWNATGDTVDRAGYFCCLQGQVGLQTGYCVDQVNAVTAGPPAVPLSTGAGAVVSGTPTAASSASASAPAASSQSAATTASGASSSSKATSSGPATAISSSGSGSSSASPTTAKSSSSAASSLATANSSAASATAKSDAMGANYYRGTTLGVALAALFAFALL